MAVVVATALISNACYAEPIYLYCEWNTGETIAKIYVKTDDTNGRITFTFPNKDPDSTEVFLSANEISFHLLDNPTPPLYTSKEVFKINRSDLSLAVTFMTTWRNRPEKTDIMYGSCKAVSASFHIDDTPLTSEEMDAADHACSHQSLDSKHKGINATSARYNSGGSRINVVCSDNNELVLLSAREKKALYNLNVTKAETAALSEKIRALCEQHSGPHCK